jgi:CarD family transcriptional regulator
MAQKQKMKAAAGAVKPVKTASATKPAARTATPVKSLGAKTAPVKASVAPVKSPVKATADKAPALKAAAAKAAPVKGNAMSEMKKASAKMASLKAAVGSKASPSKGKPVAPAPVKAESAKATLKVAPVATAPVKPLVAAPVQRAVPAAVGKPASQKISAPIPAVATPSALVATPKALAEKAAAARGLMGAPKKPVSARHGFKTNEFVVYPAHGVGRIVGIEEQEIAGMSLELFVITFDKEKLTLRVPTGKLASIGMRKLAEEPIVKRAMETLKGRARVKRTMWSRRAQEYVAKINSGDLISIAEVVRDLYRSEAQPEQSYSERQLYENALERMAREIAAVERLDERGAVQRIVEILSKSAKGRRLAAEGADASAAAADDIKAA